MTRDEIADNDLRDRLLDLIAEANRRMDWHIATMGPGGCERRYVPLDALRAVVDTHTSKDTPVTHEIATIHLDMAEEITTAWETAGTGYADLDQRIARAIADAEVRGYTRGFERAEELLKGTAR